MARKNNNKGNSKNQHQSPAALKVKVDTDKQFLDNLEHKLEEVVQNNEIQEAEIQEVISNNEETKELVTVTNKSAQDVYHKALAVEKILEKKKNEYEQLKEKTLEQKNLLEKEKSEKERLNIELKEKLAKYNEELTEINRLRVDGSWASVIDKTLLDHYENQLKEQEKLLVLKISEITKKHSAYISAINDLESKKIEQETEFQQKIISEKERLVKVYQEQFDSKENELDLLLNELEEQKRALEKKQRQLDYDTEDFEEEKKYLIDKATKKVAQEIEDINQQLEDLKDKNEALNNELLSLKDELKYLGTYNAKDIISELRSKENELFQLREQLETSPDILKIDELKRLQKEKNDWQNKLRETDAQLNEYKSRYENQKLQIGEKESLEFQKEELEQRIKLQQSALEELKEEVNELTRKTEDKVTFVSCVEMDDKFKQASENLIQNKIAKSWIKDIQQAIAQITENKLYYDENTIRSFISGLAMSRFSILQGISGTGKTSLPKAFAKAIGGNFGIVEVQSGWKDRQDLIGYYNTFEKKYYEGKFLKLLYMAGTPKYCDMPFFIILDEMNLSHPEHYFADLLSVMEETNPEKQILTISDKVKDKPNLMLELEEGGIGLKIPQNVWFIGTANNDETTLQFAAKTYDRANILEMPTNKEVFDITTIDCSKITVSNNEFLKFIKDNELDKSSTVIEYLNGPFKAICNKLDIGWGNRLEKQIKLFVPVFKALGGNDADALDHIIASKILRSVVGRYDLQDSTLNEMKDELEKNFRNKFDFEPPKSLKIVKDELNKLK